MKYLLTIFAALSLLLNHSVLALSFPLPPKGEDLVGESRTITARYEDTLSDIARQHDLGFLEITESNPGVDPWLPGKGTKITLPTHFILPPGPRQGIVINLAELRLYYYPESENRVITYPLGIGREGWSTPTGRAKIIKKQRHPYWLPPESIRNEHANKGKTLPEVVPPGPDNPLGDYALTLSLPGYLLHGTNKPYGVGMRVSHGCIRLYPEDIAPLFDAVPLNTPVRIINVPYKAGWSGGRLYIEAHGPLAEQISEQGQNHTPAVRAVIRAISDRDFKPDWESIIDAVDRRLGAPLMITEAPRAAPRLSAKQKEVGATRDPNL